MIKVNIKPSFGKVVAQNILKLFSSAIDCVDTINTAIHKKNQNKSLTHHSHDKNH